MCKHAKHFEQAIALIQKFNSFLVDNEEPFIDTVALLLDESCDACHLCLIKYKPLYFRALEQKELQEGLLNAHILRQAWQMFLED